MGGPGWWQRPHRRAYRHRELLHWQRSDRAGSPPGEPGTHAYLVPFRALAAEVYEAFQELLAGTDARVRISTGDHRDLLRPDEADLVVATYESFAGLLQRASFRPGVAPRSSRCCSVQVVRQGEPQPLLWYRVMEGQAEWILLR
jgi:hypothetical protein